MDNEIPGRDGLVSGLGFEEAREEIPRVGPGLLVVRGVRRAFTFCNACEPKSGDGVHADGL